MRDQVILCKSEELMSDDTSWSRQSANYQGTLKSVFGSDNPKLDWFCFQTEILVKATDDSKMLQMITKFY